MTQKLVPLLVALALLAALIIAFLPGPVPVEVATLARGPLSVTLEEEGRTRVRDRYAVAAPVAGFVRRIELKVGDAVAAGQVVAHIEPARAAALDPRMHAQAVAEVARAEAALAAAREAVQAAAAESALAEQELKRAETLKRDGFVAQAAVDQARARQQAGAANRQVAEAQARAAEHHLGAARAVLAEAGQPARQGVVTVRAPVAGRVLAVPHESEGPVQPGQALVELGDPASLEVLVEVLSTAAVRLAPGTPVRIDRWGGETPLAGVVRVVEPAGFTKVSALGVEEQRVRVLVDLTSPPETWRRLADGYRVEAEFTLWHADEVLLAPAGALFKQGEGWAVFAVQDGRARLRPIQVGQRGSLQVQVLDGLKAGDAVVARPDDRITDGTRVEAR